MRPGIAENDDQSGVAFSGRCLCGDVRYAVTGRFESSLICHRRDCQRQTGAAYSVIASIDAARFAVEGSPSSFTTIGASGGAVRRFFCARCGSPIYSNVAAAPGLIWIKTGTLDRPGPAPTAHLWWSTAQPWIASDPADQRPRYLHDFAGDMAHRSIDTRREDRQ